jgi:hypothetical protein
LLAALLIAGGMSLGNVILGRRRNLNIVSFVMVMVGTALGGSRVPVGNFRITRLMSAWIGSFSICWARR